MTYLILSGCLDYFGILPRLRSEAWGLAEVFSLESLELAKPEPSEMRLLENWCKLLLRLPPILESGGNPITSDFRLVAMRNSYVSCNNKVTYIPVRVVVICLRIWSRLFASMHAMTTDVPSCHKRQCQWYISCIKSTTVWREHSVQELAVLQRAAITYSCWAKRSRRGCYSWNFWDRSGASLLLIYLPHLVHA